MDSNQTTCHHLEKLHSNPGHEFLMDIPYHANVDTCHTEFNFNITMRVTNISPIEVINNVLKVMTSDTQSRTSSWYTLCSPYKEHVENNLIKIKYLCKCQKHCFLRLQIRAPKYPTSIFELCFAKIYW